jgi:hypothetical protein
MTGNLDSKIVCIDSFLQVEMAGKCSIEVGEQVSEVKNIEN